VSLRVEGVAAVLAGRSAAVDHRRRVSREREHLLTGREQAQQLGLFLQEQRGVVLVELGLELLDLEQEQVGVLLVADRETAGAPPRFERLLEIHLVLAGTRARLEPDRGEEVEDRSGEETDLLLLTMSVTSSVPWRAWR